MDSDFRIQDLEVLTNDYINKLSNNSEFAEIFMNHPNRPNINIISASSFDRTSLDRNHSHLLTPCNTQLTTNSTIATPLTSPENFSKKGSDSNNQKITQKILAWENDIPIEKLDESTFYFRNISARQSSNKDNIQSPPSREQNSTEPSPDNHYPASKATRRPTDSSGIGSSICVSNDFANLYQEPSTHPRDLKDHLRLVRSTLNETKMLNEEKERQHPFQNCLEIDVSSGNDVQRFISDNLLSITDTLLTLYPNKVSPSDSSSSDNLSLDESI